VATPSPIDPPVDPVLESAVRKLQAGKGLTDAEREAVRARGGALIEEDLSDERVPEDERHDMDPDEEDEWLEDEVLADADRREGRYGTPWREAFAQLGIPIPPAE
jgi:hypothetical protein